MLYPSCDFNLTAIFGNQQCLLYPYAVHVSGSAGQQLAMVSIDKV